jgi:hypothetical protein
MIMGSCLKTAPTPDSNSMNGTAGIVLMATNNNTEGRNELLDICMQNNQIHNELTESTAGQEEHHPNNKLDTPPIMKEGCIKKKLRGGKREVKVKI